MVSYDDAVAIIQDPQADPVTLAKVAYENPEFGANVAAHPRAYPGLLRWIAQFGDERARATVAQLGYHSQLGAVEDRQVDAVAIDEAAAIAAAIDAAQANAASRPTAAASPAVDNVAGGIVMNAATAGDEAQPIASQTGTVEYASVEAQPVSFEPAQQTGVDMLSEQFNNIGMDASQTNMDASQSAAASPSVAAPDMAQQPMMDQAQPADAYAQIQATNPYGFTAEVAMTTPDTTVMQQIAQYAPELHPALAQNPYIYPELLSWLGMLGEPATNASIAQRQQQ